MGMEIFWEFSNIPKNLGILGMGMKFVGMGIPTVWPSLGRPISNRINSGKADTNIIYQDR